jgi:uncharacterized membrane protein
MSKKHTLIMLACCLIPIAAFVAIFVFKIAVSAVVYGVIMLFCPLSHLLMMKFMGHDHGQSTNEHNHNPALNTDVK